jgi:acyl-CoA thioester hydrolase
MDPVFRLQFRVSAEVVDANRHVNNVAYVQWMQDAAIAHAEACGGARLAQELGGSWFVRMHRIEYLKPAFLNDELTVLTWVADWRKVRSLRRYRFIRSSDQTVLAEGETEWVFVDAATGRPRIIPERIVGVFGVATEASVGRRV